MLFLFYFARLLLFRDLVCGYRFTAMSSKTVLSIHQRQCRIIQPKIFGSLQVLIQTTVRLRPCLILPLVLKCLEALGVTIDTLCSPYITFGGLCGSSYFVFEALLLYYTTYLIVVTVWVEILWVWESQISKEQLGIAF